MKNLSSLIIIAVIISACNDSIMKPILYDNGLKKLEYKDLIFHIIELPQLPEPYYSDYSHHQNATARNHKSYDTIGFREHLLQQLSEKLDSKVLQLILISPKSASLSYEAFAYLANKQIVALQIENKGHFKSWMDIIFLDMTAKVLKNKKDGLYERQPELNSNPQFKLTISKGQFQKSYVNSGMLVDDTPYEQTGKYLYKQAPAQYNEAKIAREKQKYIQKYVNTSLPDFHKETLLDLWEQLVAIKVSGPMTEIDYSTEYKHFEELTGFPFPENIKVLYSIPNAILDIHGLIPLTPTEIIEYWQQWKVIYDDPNWMLTDLTGNNLPDGRKTLGIYTNPYWVPFMATVGGNFVALDFAPGSKGVPGQIIAFGTDEIKIRHLADSLTDFLEQIVSGKDAWNNGF